MLARRLTTILPAMTLAEVLETTRLHRLEVLCQPLEEGVTKIPSRGRHESSCFRCLSGKGRRPQWSWQKTVGTHHDGNLHSALSANSPHPLQCLPTPRAFRLTPAQFWSTDTPSKKYLGADRVETPPRPRTSRSLLR